MAGAISDLFPPKDLLDGVGNVESQLRQRRRLGLVGRVALLYTVLQAALLIAKAVNEQAEQKDIWTSATLWLVLVAVVLLLLAVGLVAWYYFWLRESRQPFQFTYWVHDFTPFPDRQSAAVPGVEHLTQEMKYLAHDLSDRLAEKIDRLKRREEDAPAAAAPDAAGRPPARSAPDGAAGPDAPGPPTGWESHISIRGTYAVRDVPPSKAQAGQPPGKVLVVTPWIRVGAPGSSETRAHPVRIELPPRAAARPGRAGEADGERSARSDREHYERLLNWLYFHVASEIYGRIRGDVERRIGLLPTRRLRVAAYLREADDYAASPTFDGYSDAAGLYELALQAIDRSARPFPGSDLQRSVHQVLLRLHEGWSGVRAKLAVRGWSRFARVDLVTARAEIGYARATINRQILAMLSGRRQVLVGLARVRADLAVKRLTALPSDESTRQARFEARTELALALQRLDYPLEAQQELERARATAPLTAATDPRYLLAHALDEPNPRKARERFERALEASRHGDEIAQYLYAEAWELVWRGRLVDDLDRTGAEAICGEYRRVLELNPGNLSAWTSLGYINWLVGDGEAAQLAFRRGLDYKEIQTETYVAELDYGLARKFAEEGRFTAAYERLSKAGSAIVSSEMVYGRRAAFSGLGPSDVDPVLGKRRLLGGLNSFMFFDHVSPAIVRRFRDYVATVERLAGCPLPDDPQVQPYMRDVVLAWALTDYAQACEAFFRRTGDRRWRHRAVQSLRRALDLDPKQWLARYALYSLAAEPFAAGQPTTGPSPRHGERGDGLDYLMELKRLVPQWVRPSLDELRTSPSPTVSQVRQLLPHDWLSGGEDRPIDYETLARGDYMRENRWEKEFEDPHVQALEVWALRYADFVRARGAAEARPEDVGTVQDRIFDHVRRHFRADWDVLYHLPPPLGPVLTYDWLLRSFLRDPVSWERLQWIWALYLRRRELSDPHRAPAPRSFIDRVVPPELPPGAMIDHLREVLRSTNWARPALYRWLAYAFRRLQRDAEADGRTGTPKPGQDPEAIRRLAEAAVRNAGTARLEAMLRSATADSEWRMAAQVDAARVLADEGRRWKEWHLPPVDYWRLREALLREQSRTGGRSAARRGRAGLALVDLTGYVELQNRDRQRHAPAPVDPPPAASPLGAGAMRSPDAAAPAGMADPVVRLQLAPALLDGLDASQVARVRAEMQGRLAARMRLIGIGGDLEVEVRTSDQDLRVRLGRTGAWREAGPWSSAPERDELDAVRAVMDVVERSPEALVGPEQVDAYRRALQGRANGAPGTERLPFTAGQLATALRWLVGRGVPVRDALSLRSLLADVQRGGFTLEEALEAAYCRRRSRWIWLTVNPGDFGSTCTGEWRGAPGRLRPAIVERLGRKLPGRSPALALPIRVTASWDVQPQSYRVAFNDLVAVHVHRPPQELEKSLPGVLFERRDLVIGVDDVERLLSELTGAARLTVRSLLASHSMTDVAIAARHVERGDVLKAILPHAGVWRWPGPAAADGPSGAGGSGPAPAGVVRVARDR